ncbi:Proteasome activator complex subunit 4A [Bienertia sinuspersici]
MWRRIFSSSNGVKAEIGGERGAMMMQWVRYMSKKRAENLKKINPKVPYSEATSIAQNLFNLIQHRGPVTIGSAWTNAQEAGISGISSKTHMKILLKWMRGKRMLKQVCQQVGSSKKFLLCTPQDIPAVQATGSPRIKLRTEKRSKSGKKR